MTDDNAAIRGRLFAAAWRGEEHDLRQILEQNKELVNAQVTNFLTIFFSQLYLPNDRDVRGGASQIFLPAAKPSGPSTVGVDVEGSGLPVHSILFQQTSAQ